MENKQADVQHIYDKYAGMLLGYITEVVKNKNLAEKYLIKIFSEISLDYEKIDWNEQNGWCQLLKYAQVKLSTFNNTAIDGADYEGAVVYSSGNKNLSEMTSVQRQVFCDVYYKRKSINAISIQINQPEDSIRKVLKEAFIILRRSCGN